ncbi:40098_t:CDS:2, partial [Gigaspora margarita]
IQQKNSYKKLLKVEKKILLEEKLEDEKTSSRRDGLKIDHFILNKKRNIDSFDGSSTKKKMNNRIRVTEMTLNENKIEVLTGDNLEEAKKKQRYFMQNKPDRSIEPILEEILVTKTNLNIESKDKMVIDIQGKKKKATESITSKEASTSRSHILDKILRRLQNIEERQRTYVSYCFLIFAKGELIDTSKPTGLHPHVASLVNNIKTENTSQSTSPQ